MDHSGEVNHRSVLLKSSPGKSARFAEAKSDPLFLVEGFSRDLSMEGTTRVPPFFNVGWTVSRILLFSFQRKKQALCKGIEISAFPDSVLLGKIL